MLIDRMAGPGNEGWHEKNHCNLQHQVASIKAVALNLGRVPFSEALGFSRIHMPLADAWEGAGGVDDAPCTSIEGPSAMLAALANQIRITSGWLMSALGTLVSFGFTGNRNLTRKTAFPLKAIQKGTTLTVANVLKCLFTPAYSASFLILYSLALFHCRPV